MPKKKLKKIVAYRNSRTGRFVKKSTWKRSKALGGARYKRVLLPRKRKEKQKPHKRKQKPRKQRREPLKLTYILSFNYSRKKNKGRVEAEFHFRGPQVTRSQFLDIVTEFIIDGSLPSGWDSPKAILWGGGKKAKEYDGDKVREVLKKIIESGSTPQVRILSGGSSGK